jgi:hypothetical protein
MRHLQLHPTCKLCTVALTLALVQLGVPSRASCTDSVACITAKDNVGQQATAPHASAQKKLQSLAVCSTVAAPEAFTRVGQRPTLVVQALPKTASGRAIAPPCCVDLKLCSTDKLPCPTFMPTRTFCFYFSCCQDLEI